MKLPVLENGRVHKPEVDERSKHDKNIESHYGQDMKSWLTHIQPK